MNTHDAMHEATTLTLKNSTHIININITCLLAFMYLMDEEMASLYILEFKKTNLHWHFEFQRPIYILGDVICAY